ncbi:unnamed protein product [Protopolystoma xenopodis]|uniref:Uncharacterized protein n=1 Tax=Protopolystoma xenopodis TaxID=117903 RepID=A0A3S5FGP0_9PLAT|nr:unnamed protein product [Protopolystoma xenopodis]
MNVGHTRRKGSYRAYGPGVSVRVYLCGNVNVVARREELGLSIQLTEPTRPTAREQSWLLGRVLDSACQLLKIKQPDGKIQTISVTGSVGVPGFRPMGLYIVEEDRASLPRVWLDLSSRVDELVAQHHLSEHDLISVGYLVDP